MNEAMYFYWRQYYGKPNAVRVRSTCTNEQIYHKVNKYKSNFLRCFLKFSAKYTYINYSVISTARPTPENERTCMAKMKYMCSHNKISPLINIAVDHQKISTVYLNWTRRCKLLNKGTKESTKVCLHLNKLWNVGVDVGKTEQRGVDEGLDLSWRLVVKAMRQQLEGGERRHAVRYQRDAGNTYAVRFLLVEEHCHEERLNLQ